MKIASGIRTTIAQWGVEGLWRRVLADQTDFYPLWVRRHAPTREALRAQRQRSRELSTTVSLITFAAEGEGWPGGATLSALLEQTNPRWEWIIVAPARVVETGTLDTELFERDARIRLLKAPDDITRSDAWNAAWREARGTFAAVLDGGDTLSPSALYEITREVARAPSGDVFYCDEDRLSRDGSRHEPRFKPEWSPELFLACNYIGRLTLIRRETALAAGGFRNGFEGEEEWDLLLRISRLTTRICRVPLCLYHRHGGGAADSGPMRGAALKDYCREAGLDVEVSRSANALRIVWPSRQASKVSIVIPTRDAAPVIKRCVRGLLEETSYPCRELVIVDNGSTDPEVLSLFESIERSNRGLVVPFKRPFNFSEACNAGAAAATGDLLLFLNNDVEVLEADWLDELVRWAERPDIGIVGAKLLYPNRTVQHAGVVFGIGLVGHIFSQAPEGTSGLFGSTESYRNYLAVTGACQMMRREVFERLGGYDERFRLSFSDIVICMKAWRAGYRVVYTPHARLIHHESYTRKREDWPNDLLLLARHLQSERFEDDPFFHPELNPASHVPRLRPPFAPTPRQAVGDYVERVLAGSARVS